MENLPHTAVRGDQDIDTVGYLFVIDTDSSGGQFESEELLAAMTGCMHESPREGEQLLAERFRQDYPDAYSWIEDALLELPDEEFGHPCFIQKFETPGWLNDGYGNMYREDQAPPFESMYMGHAWYAYQSVRLTFDRALTENEVAFLCERARAYAEQTRSFVIEGFRLLREERVTACLDVFTPDGVRK
jgi:hypothetical protein